MLTRLGMFMLTCMYDDTRTQSGQCLTNGTASRRSSRRNDRHRALALLATGAIAAVAGCSDSEPAANAGATAPNISSTLAPTADPSTAAVTNPPATAAPHNDPALTAAPAINTSTTVTDELAGQIEAVLTDAVAPGVIRWDANGVNVPPTAAIAAVRIPGRDDVLVVVGENVDGSPAHADDPFPVATLTESLVRTVAFQMVDQGVLDPTLTVDHWAPTLPNANRVTVQMLLDNETGWSDYGQVEPDPIVTDFSRAWTLREAVEARAPVMTALGEPGTRTNDGSTNEMTLGLVVQEVGGRPLMDLVRDMVTQPTGLDDTGWLDGHNAPAGYRHGVFAYNGMRADASQFNGVSLLTWNQATHSVVSTPSDLLDLLDAWSTGELFTTDRTSAPDRYAPDPAGNPNIYAGIGVPFNGYCPCTETDGGIEPTAIGRVPGGLGTRTYLWRYADGISVVVNLNSNEMTDPAAGESLTHAIHDLAAAAR